MSNMGYKTRAELEKEIDTLKKEKEGQALNMVKLMKQIADQEIKLKKAMEGLEFYADESNYEKHWKQPGNRLVFYVMDDNGQIVKDTLTAIK